MFSRLLLVLCLATLLAAPSAAAPRFHLVDLGFVPGGTSASAARFGSDGTIVGSCEFAGLGAHATRWDVVAGGGSVVATDLGGLPGFDWSGARGINGSGWIVGHSNTTNPEPRGVLWRNGEVVDIEQLSDGSANIYANDINGSNVICGFLIKSGGGNRWRAAIWTERPSQPGRFDRFDLPLHVLADTAFSWTEAIAIDAAGRVFGRTNLGASGGERATIWEADAAHTPVLLEPLPGLNQSTPGDFNDAGDAVGSSIFAFGLDMPTRWSRDAAHVASPLSLWPGHNAGAAAVVDPSGANVLGTSSLISIATFPPTVLEQRTVIWSEGAIWDLSERLDASGAGWTVIAANDMNAQGWIAATAVRSGPPHAVLLLPVPDATAAPPADASRLALAAPFPNPSRGTVRLSFKLAQAGQARVRVVDAQGRAVAVLFEGPASSGQHELAWTGSDNSGAPVPAGIYFANLEAGGRRVTRRIARVR